MARYILRRLLLMMIVLLGMSVITFALTHIVPGNPARLLAGQHATQEQVEAVAKLYGLDRPVVEQYWVYIGGLFRGDLGMSLTTRRPVADDLRQYLPATIELTTAAMLLVIGLGLPTGLLAAIRRGRPLDHLIRVSTVAGVSMPIFWFGIVLQILFYRKLQLLPIGGRLGIIDIEPPRVTGAYVVDTLLAGDFDTFLSALVHLILPAATLAAGSIAVVTRMMRASVIEVLDADHVRQARAKGLVERIVLGRHVFRNALIPTTTVIGLQVGTLLAGNVLTEVVFNWPGIGLYAVNAIRYLDYSAIMGVTLTVSIIYVFVNLLVDIAYVLLDPRISYGSASSPGR
jgi:ABC-type dipeptide/oligopeptide/nickel transport system permease component